MSLSQKILIVDDEEDILKLLKTVLIKEGFEHVHTAATANEGWRKFQDKQPDLVILDIMLPDGEGYDVCKQIRSVSNVPIFFLSAKTEEIDKILGFAIGGDDYITKPFSPKEVAYRIKARFRRAEAVPEEEKKDRILKAGPFELNEQTFELKKKRRNHRAQTEGAWAVYPSAQAPEPDHQQRKPVRPSMGRGILRIRQYGHGPCPAAEGKNRG